MYKKERSIISLGMLYNLPGGKTINISVEQFLSMTDDDIQYMVANNFGGSIRDPFTDSGIKRSEKKELLFDEEEDEEDDDTIIFDDTIDYENLLPEDPDLD